MRHNCISESIFGLIFLLLLCLEVCKSLNKDEQVIHIYVCEGEENQKKVAILYMEKRNDDYKSVNCDIITDKSRVDLILGEVPVSHRTEVSGSVFQQLENECKDYHSRNQTVNIPTQKRQENVTVMGAVNASTEDESSWNIIFPGTKWCGAGDKAKNYDDLGMHSETDKCCRAHDKCDDLIIAGKEKHNLTNKSPFTKLSCKCDNDFYDCLDNVDSMISNKIGNLYFNILKRDCFTFDYPHTKKCKTFRSFLKITCKEYQKDTSKPKVYRWEHAKLYKKLPIPGPITINIPFL